jgi:hypothetical protein
MSDATPEREEAAEALLEGLGMTQKDGQDRKEKVGQDWLADVREKLTEGEAPSAPEEGAEEKEGFIEDNEAYLKQKMGRDANRWAEELKQRDEQIAELRKQVEGMAAPPPEPTEVTTERVKEMLFKGGNLYGDETYDPLLSDMAEAMQRVDQRVTMFIESKMAEMDKKLETVAHGAQETGLRAEYGIDRNVEAEFLREHPDYEMVRNNVTPDVWMAVLKDRLSADARSKELQAAPEARAIPRQRAEEYVESSAIGLPATDELEAMREKLKDADSRTELSVLGQLFKESGEF